MLQMVRIIEIRMPQAFDLDYINSNDRTLPRYILVLVMLYRDYTCNVVIY